MLKITIKEDRILYGIPRKSGESFEIPAAKAQYLIDTGRAEKYVAKKKEKEVAIDSTDSE